MISPVARLVQYAWPHRFRVLLASLFTALSTIFDLLPDLLIGIAVDVVVKKEQSWLSRIGIADVNMQLILLGCAACIIWVLEATCEYLYAYLWRTIAQNLQHELRIETYAHVQNLGMSYYEDVSTGNLLAILNDDINQLERFLDVGIYKFVYLGTTTLVIGAVFFYFAPTVALFAFVPLPIIIGIIAYFRHYLAPRYAQVRERVSALANRIANNIMGIATIKSYTGEAYELNRVSLESQSYKDANKAVIVVSAAFTPIVRMVIVLAFIATVVLGGLQALAGTLDVGIYSVLVFQTQRLLWPAAELAEMTDLYERAMASIKRIFNLLDTSIDIADGVQPLALASVQGRIDFDHVSFAYPHGVQIFKDLTVTINPGQVIAFVGSTGSGKSTLIKLLLRFYNPTQGSIKIDGIDIKTLAMRDLRQAISWVSQDVFLFHGTVRENIAYGSFGAHDCAIKDAARVAQAHDFIMNLPQGYDTIIGERGQKLSGGQRQRLSIARAVLKNSPIFVFDEATSSVDNETEAAIARSLDLLTVHHTVIIIAHRLSTICNAHTIFVLDDGKIVESGVHQELLDKGGIYSGLWHVQTGGITRHDAPVQPVIQRAPTISLEQ